MKAVIKENNEIVSVYPINEERDLGIYLSRNFEGVRKQFDEADLLFFSSYNGYLEELEMSYYDEAKPQFDQNRGNLSMEDLDALSYKNKDMLVARFVSDEQLTDLKTRGVNFYCEYYKENKNLIAICRSELEQIKDIVLSDIHNHNLGNSTYKEIELLSIKQNTYVGNVDIELNQLESLSKSNLKYHAMESYSDDDKYTVYFSLADENKLIKTLYQENPDYKKLFQTSGKLVSIQLPSVIKNSLNKSGINHIDADSLGLGTFLKKDDLYKVYIMFCKEGLKDYHSPNLAPRQRNPIKSR